jgi:hypothetical protein
MTCRYIIFDVDYCGASRSKVANGGKEIPESLASAGGWNRNNQNCVMIVYNSDCRIHG